jgi:hypothetical protein
MRHLKLLGLGVMMALLLAAFVGATSASATTICVGGAVTGPCTDGHPGGTVVLGSTNSALQVLGSGAASIQCAQSTIHGTAPSGSATTLAIPVTLTYSGCTALSGFIGATVTVHPGCQDRITLLAMYNQAAAPQGSATITIPSGCTITASVPTVSCTMTIPGEQTITGSIAWRNGTTTAPSHATLTSAHVPTIDVHAGGGFGCPAAGAHTGALSGTYKVETPGTSAPGVTLIP